MTEFLGITRAEEGPGPRVAVLPVPLEATTSYEIGTAAGPQAILRASAQVELYDRELGCDAVERYGLQTLPPLEPPAEVAQGEAALGRFLETVAQRVEGLVREGFFPLLLGGEHSLSIGTGRGLMRAAGEELAVVQFDAHRDLRDAYAGNRYSHACAARRLLEEGPGPLVQVGIRSCSREEAEFAAAVAARVTLITAEEVHEDPAAAAARLSAAVAGRKVFLTLDVDVLDPAVVPATGTPEPGGLDWRETVRLLKAVTGAARVAGLDCVELAPRPGLHHAEFTVASLLYRVLNDLFARPRRS